MKHKLFFQTAICVGVCFIAVYGQKNVNTTVSKYYAMCHKAVMHQMTVEEVEYVWNQMKSTLSNAPAKVVSAIVEVNESSKYGQPIDQEGIGTVRQVHAVAGGAVEKTGRNQKYGLYIILRHEDAISIYGNLSTAGVVEKERIQRGEIIGSFDSSGENEFYYELRTDL